MDLGAMGLTPLGQPGFPCGTQCPHTAGLPTRPPRLPARPSPGAQGWEHAAEQDGALC